MPPKPLAEDLARKKAKKDKGSGWGWFGNAVGDVIDMAKNPLDTGKALAREAKSTFVDPVWNLPKAFDPTNKMSGIDRINTAASGALAVADALTPAIPEGAIANRATRKIAGAVDDIGLNAPAIRPVISPSGLEFPRNAATTRYESAMKDLARVYGNRSAVPSIQVQGSQIPKILAAGQYAPGLDPTAGYIGLANRLAAEKGVDAGSGYAAIRNELEQNLGGPVYGHIRNPLDVQTASQYRTPRAFMNAEEAMSKQAIDDYWRDFAAQGIFDFTPKPGATVTPGDSYMMFRRLDDIGRKSDFPKIVQPYDPSLPPIVHNAPTPEVYQQPLRDIGEYFAEKAGAARLPYAEIQAPPVDVADMQRLTVIRDANQMTPTYAPATEQMGMRLRRQNAMQTLAANRALAAEARAAGLDVVTGQTKRGSAMLTERNLEQLRGKPGFMDFLMEEFFIPDRQALDLVNEGRYRAQLRTMAQEMARQRRSQLATRAAVAPEIGANDLFLARGKDIA